MYKLIILVSKFPPGAFEQRWPQFLHLAEQMPGLKRETTSQVKQTLFGELHGELIHELYFDTLDSLYQALNSPPGQQAGETLQALTAGQMILMIADHREDELENIRQRRAPAGDERG